MTTTVPGVALNERAMLIDLSISMMTLSKKDKKVTAEVAQLHQASNNAGKYQKQLLDKDEAPALGKLAAIAGRARATFYEMTLPWLDTGARILPSASFFDFDAKFSAYNAEWNDALDEFEADYPRYVNERARSLNGMFNPNDYVPSARVRQEFGFGYKVFPLPKPEETKDFRQVLGEDVAERLAHQVEQSITDALANGQRDMLSRVAKVVGHMANSLREYEPEKGKAGHPFRDSLVENVRELANLLPALNINADKAVADITDRITAELTRHDADVLRESATTRENVAKSAEDILAAVAGIMA